MIVGTGVRTLSPATSGGLPTSLSLTMWGIKCSNSAKNVKQRPNGIIVAIANHAKTSGKKHGAKQTQRRRRPAAPPITQKIKIRCWLVRLHGAQEIQNTPRLSLLSGKQPIQSVMRPISVTISVTVAPRRNQQAEFIHPTTSNNSFPRRKASAYAVNQASPTTTMSITSSLLRSAAEMTN